MMTVALEKALVSSTTEFAREMVKALAEKYVFDETEALLFLELSSTNVVRVLPKTKVLKKVKMLTPSMSLPFCGVVMDNWCKGIRPNHELFTQCTIAAKNGSYCATCAGQAKSNDTDKPTHGDIRDRMLVGKDWRTPAGKLPMNYGNVMSKRNIEKNVAIVEAATFGWVIPEEEFEVKVRKAGRPKSPNTSDTEDEIPKKKRGRPSKKKVLVSGDDTNDLIDMLVSNSVIISDDNLPTEEINVEEVEPPVVNEVEPTVVNDVEPTVVNEVEPTVVNEVEPTVVKEVEPPVVKEVEQSVIEAKKAISDAKRKLTAAKKKAEKEAILVAKAEEPEVEAEEVSSDDELSAEADCDESDEEEASEVVIHVFNGKTYYRDEETNAMYQGDMDDPELVGTWDPENKCIVADSV